MKKNFIFISKKQQLSINELFKNVQKIKRLENQLFLIQFEAEFFQFWINLRLPSMLYAFIRGISQAICAQANNQ